VRVLLQNKVDETYFQSAGSWVTDPDEAQDFFTTDCALNKAAKLRGVAVQIVLKWPEMTLPRFEVVIPLANQRTHLR
jgi:hypothetical protein